MDLENQFEKEKKKRKTLFSHSLTHLQPAGPVSPPARLPFPSARVPFSFPSLLTPCWAGTIGERQPLPRLLPLYR
jgi:hypothetical protein